MIRKFFAVFVILSLINTNAVFAVDAEDPMARVPLLKQPPLEDDRLEKDRLTRLEDHRSAEETVKQRRLAEETVRQQFRKFFVSTLPLVLSADSLLDYNYDFVHPQHKPYAVAAAMDMIVIVYTILSCFYVIDFWMLNRNSNEQGS